MPRFFQLSTRTTGIVLCYRYNQRFWRTLNAAEGVIQKAYTTYTLFFQKPVQGLQKVRLYEKESNVKPLCTLYVQSQRT